MNRRLQRALRSGTRAFTGERDIQRGVLLGLMYRKFGVTGHVFNPDTGNPIFILSLDVEFRVSGYRLPGNHTEMLSPNL